MSGSVKTTSSRKLAFNYVLLSGGEALSKVFAFLAFAYLARLVGPDIFGDIEFALAVTMFFNLVVEGGLGLLGAREIAKDEKIIASLTFHIVIMRIVLALIAFLLLCLFVILNNKSPQENQIVILYGLTLFGTPGLLQWVFQGLDRMQWVALSSIIRWSLFAVLVFLFITRPHHVLVVPVLELVAVGIVVAFNFSIFRKSFGSFRQRFDISLCKSLLSQAMPIGLSQVAWGLRAYLPTIMLGLLVGGSAVGWFGAAQRIVVALHTFVWMYFFNIYPSISRCTRQEPEAFQNLLGKSLKVTSWCAVFIGSAGTLFAEPLIQTVYGTQYDAAAKSFQVLVWYLSIILVSGHYMYALFAYNKQKLELASALCGSVFSFVLIIALIHKYNFMGAAYAIVCVETLIWLLNYYFTRVNIAVVPFFSHLIKPLFAGLVMIVLVKLIPPLNIFLLGAIACLLYGSGLLILQPAVIKDFRALISKDG